MCQKDSLQLLQQAHLLASVHLDMAKPASYDVVAYTHGALHVAMHWM